MVELFIYLGEPCHVCHLLLTISHGADDSTYPSTIDVRTGRNLDNLKLVLEVRDATFFNFVIKALLQELASCNCTGFPIFDVYMYQVIPRTRFYLYCIVQVVTPVISNRN